MTHEPRPCVACGNPTTATSDATNGPRCLECGGCEHTKWAVCFLCGYECSGSHGYYMMNEKKVCGYCYRKENDE